LTVFVLLIALTSGHAGAAEWSASLQTGYRDGFGLMAHGAVRDLGESLPLGLRVGLGYTSVDPGNAADARRIFINDATNGTPEQSGMYWDFRFDLTYDLKREETRWYAVFAGPRYMDFTGNFKFIGGNEDFDVVSSGWGVGGGVEAGFAIGRAWALFFALGVDYFPKSTLTGHDTSYSPDGEDVNPRNDYTYDTADEAINQPSVEPMLMIGVNFAFGR
jgi:hypothetical protein